MAFIPPVALAEPELNAPILEQAFLWDSSGSMTIEQVSHAQFTPYSSTALNRGHTQSVTWIKLTLQTSASQADALALRIKPHFLDSIDLYEKVSGAWVMRSAGDRYPYSQQHNDGDSFRFVIHLSPHQENQYYLKIKTSGLTFISIQASTIATADQESQDDKWLFGIQFGAFLLLLGWAIINYLGSQDRVYGIFAIFQVIVILFNLSAQGILSRFIFPTNPLLDDLGFSYLFCLRTATSVWLGWAILRSYEIPKWYPNACRVFYGICLTQLIAISLGYVQGALIFNFLLAFVLPYLQIFVIQKTTKVPPEMRLVLLTGYSLIALTLTFAFISINGFVDIGIYLSSLLRWIGTVNGLILVLIIWMGNEVNRESLKKDSLNLTILQAQSAIEKKLLQERSTLIDMLVHELKNPLATVRMAIGSLKMNLQEDQKEEHQRIHNMSTAVGNMNAVIERCMLVDQFDQNKLIIRSVNIELKYWTEQLLEKKECVDRVISHIADDIIVQTDPQLLSIALENLLDNALKYAPPTSLITIDAALLGEEKSDCVSITIANQAGDFGTPDPDKVFKRYYRNPYAQKTSGTGLGLYLTQSICTILSGQIRYEPRENLICFLVELPIQLTAPLRANS